MKEIEYIQVGDYQLPNLKVEEMHLNRFGRAKLDYLKKHDYGLYFKLLTKNELKDYLLKVQKEADDLYDRLVEEYKVKWNVTEELKKKNQIIMRFAGCSWNPYQHGNVGGGQRRRAFRFRQGGGSDDCGQQYGAVRESRGGKAPDGQHY